MQMPCRSYGKAVCLSVGLPVCLSITLGFYQNERKLKNARKKGVTELN